MHHTSACVSLSQTKLLFSKIYKTKRRWFTKYSLHIIATFITWNLLFDNESQNWEWIINCLSGLFQPYSWYTGDVSYKLGNKPKFNFCTDYARFYSESHEGTGLAVYRIDEAYRWILY